MDPYLPPPDRVPPPMPPSEDQNTTANRVGDVVGGGLDGAELIGEIGEGISGAASTAMDAVGSVVSGAAEIASGAAEAVGGAVEGLGSAVEGVGAVAEGCGSCSLAVLVMLATVGAAVAAVLH